jgi:putative ABC transport system permease protein
MLEPGTNEIVVGRAASGQFEGLDVGTTVRWGESAWRVVGIFEANGSVAESELWCDAKVLQPAYRRGNSYQSVLARLESEEALQTLKDALTTDPRLNVTVVKEADYYAEQSRVLQGIIRTIGFGIAALMGLGAIFGAVNTMYSAVSSRTREIATFRALGFGGARSSSRSSPRRCCSPRRRRARRRPGLARLRRLPDGDHELAVVQPGRLRFRRDPVPAAQGALYAMVMGFIGGSSRPSGRPACPSSPPSGSSSTERRA